MDRAAPPPGALVRAAGPPLDADYVLAFQRFADACDDLQRGPDARRRRLRGEAALAAGDVWTALRDAREVMGEEPGDADAHLLRGRAALRLAAIRLGLLPFGAGRPPSRDAPPAHRLLVEARAALRGYAVLRPADPQGRVALRAAEALLDGLLEEAGRSSEGAAASAKARSTPGHSARRML